MHSLTHKESAHYIQAALMTKGLQLSTTQLGNSRSSFFLLLLVGYISTILLQPFVEGSKHELQHSGTRKHSIENLRIEPPPHFVQLKFPTFVFFLIAQWDPKEPVTIHP